MTLPASLRNILLGLGLLLVAGTILACSDDEKTPEEAVCDNLDGLRDNLSSLGEALRDGNQSEARQAVEDARQNLRELSENLDLTGVAATAAQIASEVRAQVDSISQTVQQLGQGGGGAVQLLQAVGPQLSAMVASLQTLGSELSSLRCK